MRHYKGYSAGRAIQSKLGMRPSQVKLTFVTADRVVAGTILIGVHPIADRQKQGGRDGFLFK